MIVAYKSDHDLVTDLHTLIARASKDKSIFTIALSGGSLAKQMALVPLNCDKSNWLILFADERLVPLDHPDSNYGLFADLFKTWGIQPNQVIHVNPDLIDNPVHAARDYQEQLKLRIPSFPEIDLILLGMGPDGHTASLFPGHALVEEKDLFVASICDSPKPPSKRITLTLPVLNSSRQSIFVCCGESKAPVLHDIFDMGIAYPSSMGIFIAKIVNPKSLYWLLDQGAASKIKDRKLCHSIQ